MSKTPITDANEFEIDHDGERVVRASVARKLEEQRNELLAALEFYSKHQNYRLAWGHGHTRPIWDDEGARARAAIAAATVGAK